jgi:hypothetical protein
MTRCHRLGLGAVAAVVYLALAVVSFTYGALPTLPLYDGASVGPYRFVKAPKALAEFNRPPFSFRERFPLPSDGFRALTAATLDNQATINLPDGAVEPMPGETEIEVSIDPLDPASLGSPPQRAGYDGNAYRFTGRYAASGEPLRLRVACPAGTAPGGSAHCLTVVIHYAFGPVLGRGDTRIYRQADGGWSALPTKDVPSILHGYASTGTLGTFVSAGPNRPKGTSPEPFPTGLAVLLAFGGLLAGLALRVTRPWSKLRQRGPVQ